MWQGEIGKDIDNQNLDCQDLGMGQNLPLSKPAHNNYVNEHKP